MIQWGIGTQCVIREHTILKFEKIPDMRAFVVHLSCRALSNCRVTYAIQRTPAMSRLISTPRQAARPSTEAVHQKKQDAGTRSSLYKNGSLAPISRYGHRRTLEFRYHSKKILRACRACVTMYRVAADANQDRHNGGNKDAGILQKNAQ